MVDSINKINRVERTLCANQAKDPTDQEIAELTGFSEDKVKEIRNMVVLHTESLDDAHFTDGTDKILDFLEDEKTPNPFDILSDKELHGKLRLALKKLTPRDEKVLRMRFGIGEKSVTLEEIGSKIGLCRERVRQIENNSLKKIHKSMESAYANPKVYQLNLWRSSKFAKK
jgi:RNA polymerase primary sigma factor